MNEQTYWARFYWSARQEDADQCAEHIRALLVNLAQIDEALNRFQIVDPRGETVAFSQTETQLAGALREGVNRNDVDGKPIDKLGYTLRLRNEGTHIHTAVGCYSEWVPNAFLLGPIRRSILPRLCQCSKMRSIAHAVVGHLDPDHGVVTSDEYEDLVYDYENPGFVVKPGKLMGGWLTYVSRRLAPKLPFTDNASSIDDLGQIIVATDEVFDAGIQSHVDSANRISRCLASSA